MTSSTRAVLEHLPAREQVLTQLVAALRPGGWLLVEDTDFVSFVPGSGMTDADIELFARCWTLTRAAGEARGSVRITAASYMERSVRATSATWLLKGA